MKETDNSQKLKKFGRKGPSGFSSSSTAEEVTQGIDGTGLTAIVTGHFPLTNLLLETMKATSLECRKGRIVNVSSGRHKFSYQEGIQFDKVNDPSGYTSLSAYGQSKLANILHANELARQLKEERVELTAYSLHPGANATNLYRHHSYINGCCNNVLCGIATTSQRGEWLLLR